MVMCSMINKKFVAIALAVLNLVLLGCACPPGQVLCGGSCVNTASDTNNCGACGTVCSTGQTCVGSTCTLTYDLTGTWQGNDGGTYYIRQVVNDICWFGELTPQNPGWANVAYGTINGNIINLKWADVPKSGARGSGTLSLSVIDDVTLRTQAVTGGFGGSTWTKSNTPVPSTASL